MLVLTILLLVLTTSLLLICLVLLALLIDFRSRLLIESPPEDPREAIHRIAQEGRDAISAVAASHVAHFAATVKAMTDESRRIPND